MLRAVSRAGSMELSSVAPSAFLSELPVSVSDLVRRSAKKAVSVATSMRPTRGRSVSVTLRSVDVQRGFGSAPQMQVVGRVPRTAAAGVAF